MAFAPRRAPGQDWPETAHPCAYQIALDVFTDNFTGLDRYQPKEDQA
jgi:hypothetical protein